MMVFQTAREMIQTQMSVFLGGRAETRMSEQFLQRSEIGAGRQQVSRRNCGRSACNIGWSGFNNPARRAGRDPDHRVRGAGIQRLLAEQIFSVRAAPPRMLIQSAPKQIGQNREAFLVAFAEDTQLLSRRAKYSTTSAHTPRSPAKPPPYKRSKGVRRSRAKGCSRLTHNRAWWIAKA